MKTEIASPDKNNQKISGMFDRISHKYDFLNHFLSGGFDILWRRKAVKRFEKLPANGTVLDLCAGTGDLSFSLLKNTKFNGHVFLSDFSGEMLKIADKKARKKGKRDSFSVLRSDAQKLPFESMSFDAAMVAFGIRNVRDNESALREICRVLRDGSEFIILEFGMPRSRLLRVCYGFYFNRVLPFFGKMISGHSEAYTYLPVSVDDYERNSKLPDLLNSSGFEIKENRPIMGGIVKLIYSIKQ